MPTDYGALAREYEQPREQQAPARRGFTLRADTEIAALPPVAWLIDQRFMDGAVNLAAPQPLPNREFMSALRAAWGASVGLPATAWMLEVGAFAMRTETELVLKSRRVVPRRLVKSGFVFGYPEWPAAARALCDERRPITTQSAEQAP